MARKKAAKKARKKVVRKKASSRRTKPPAPEPLDSGYSGATDETGEPTGVSRRPRRAPVKPTAPRAAIVTLWTEDRIEVHGSDGSVDEELSGPTVEKVRDIILNHCGEDTIYRLGIPGNPRKKRDAQIHTTTRQALCAHAKLTEGELGMEDTDDE